MTILHQNYPLGIHNSLGFSVAAKFATTITSEDDLRPLFADQTWQGCPYLTLGGGSNIVFTQDFPGLVMHIAIRGKRLLKENTDTWIIEAGAGEIWHDFVSWTLQQDWPGLENLALIPGSVGGAPIQNIGAYGVEMAQYCHSVRAYDVHHKKWVELDTKYCQFNYRDSIFKKNPQRYIITHVRFCLPRHWQAKLGYAELAQALAHINHPTPQQLFDAVVALRSKKLPDPKILGNVGSFFKNPIISAAQIKNLSAQFPALPNYPQADGQYKLAAGWLIEQCGFKGCKRDTVGVYEKQALVLVHFGNGNGQQLLKLAQEIQTSVRARFGVTLEIEPTII